MNYKYLLNIIIQSINNNFDIKVTDSDFEIKMLVDSSKANIPYGDISSAVALKYFRKLSYNSPQDLANDIKEILLNSEISNYINQINVENNAFINIFLTPKFYIDNLNDILIEKNTYGSNKSGVGHKVLIEYSQPNIAKEFGVHHLRSTLIGNALVRAFQFEGYEVVTDTHYGDWGTQFGMIIWAIEKDNLDYKNFSLLDFERVYVDANTTIKENPELRSEALAAFSRLEKKDQNAFKIWQTAIEISLKEYYIYYDLFNIKFDYEYGESYYLDIMPDVIQECIDKGITRVEEGATIIPFEDENGEKLMPPIFLLKSDGATTYHTRDLATIKLRNTNSALTSEKYIYQVDVAQSLHFTQLFKAAEMLGWSNTDGLIHSKHGRVSLPEGKISSRKGNHPKLRKFLELVKEKVESYYIENNKNIDQQTLQSLYVGAVKYYELRHAPTTGYVFDIDEATDLNGNTSIYIQYTYARALSILQSSSISIDINHFEEMQYPNIEGNILELHKLLANLHHNILKTVDELAPHTLVYYIFNICQLFNSLYNSEKFIGSDNEEYYLVLTKSTTIVIENIFEILNIELPKKL